MLQQLPSFYGKGNVDLRGPRGEPGEDGKQGEPGPRGEPGRDGTDAVPAEALLRLNDDVALLTSRVRDEVTQRLTDDEAFAGRLQTVEASYARQTDVELALEARVGQETTARANAIEAEAVKREEVVATLRSDASLALSVAITEEQRVRADAVTAVASRVSTIEADYTKAGDVELKVNAKVSEEAQARADAVSAEASARQTLAATLRGETAAGIAEEARVRSDALGAEASARQALTATLRGETDQKVSAAITEEQRVRSETDGALSGRLSTIEASYVTGGTVDAKVAAKVSEEASARADADGALTGRVNTLYSAFDLGVDSNLYARLRTEETARADRDGALSSRIDTVEATANGAKTTVETFSSAISTLDGRQEVYWSVTGTTPDGKTSISLTKKNGQPGEFLVDSNMRVTGDLIVDGAINLRRLDRTTMIASSSGSTSGFQGDSYPPYGIRPIPNLIVDTNVGDGGTFYFTVNATAAMNTVSGNNGPQTYNSIQVCDTSNNVLADIKLPTAAPQQGGLANYMVRTPNLWGARTVRWRLVTRTESGNYSYITDPAVTFNWTAL